MTAHLGPGEVMTLLTDKPLPTAVLDADPGDPLPEALRRRLRFVLTTACTYVEAVRRRWSLSVAAAKPALRIVDPRRGYSNFAAVAPLLRLCRRVLSQQRGRPRCIVDCEIAYAAEYFVDTLMHALHRRRQFEQKGCDSDHLTIPATGSAESREKPICS
jgi:hypothetical protein